VYVRSLSFKTCSILNDMMVCYLKGLTLFRLLLLVSKPHQSKVHLHTLSSSKQKGTRVIKTHWDSTMEHSTLVLRVPCPRESFCLTQELCLSKLYHEELEDLMTSRVPQQPPLLFVSVVYTVKAYS